MIALGDGELRIIGPNTASGRSIIASQQAYARSQTVGIKKSRNYKTLDDNYINKYMPVKKFTSKEQKIFGHSMCMVCLVDFEENESIRHV